MAPKVYTEDDVAKHSTAEDCWIILGNDSNGGEKVYDVSQYLDDHPGGAEIVLEVAGRSGDDIFENVGHSKDARTLMKKYEIGTLKVDPNAPKKERKSVSSSAGGSGGLNPMVVLFLLIAIIAGIYFSQQK